MSALGPLPGLQPGPLQAAHGLIVAPAAPAGPGPGGPPGPPGIGALIGGGPTPTDGNDDGGQAVTILRQMIDLAHKYIAVEPDAIDKETMSKVMATLMGYLAKEQKDQEAATGVTPAMRFMRKAQ